MQIIPCHTAGANIDIAWELFLVLINPFHPERSETVGKVVLSCLYQIERCWEQ